MPTIDPIILFFALGVAAGLLRSELRLPEALYETLSIYLLLAIGLKGGVELARQPLLTVAPQVVVVIIMGVCLALLAYLILRYMGRMGQPDAASIAAHYGSVSVGTFAVGIAYLSSLQIFYEEYMALFLVVLEMPALVIGILLARWGATQGPIQWGAIVHEVFLGKSIVLLVGGLLIGWIAGLEGIGTLKILFFDLFKGALALFLLEMGVVAASRISELRHTGAFLLAFGLCIPVFFGMIGTLLGVVLGFSMGGTILLATLAASASYIAAPATMRIAVPEANPTLSLTASLGITFPFNVMIGIPLYHGMASFMYGSGA